MLQQLKAASQQVLAGSILEPSPKYRSAVGVLGVALPPALLVWAKNQRVQSSISAYYYTAARDWFVGTLWVIGVFLIFYQYRPQHPELARSRRPTIRSGRADAYLGKCAGVATVLVALLPTTPPAGLMQPPIIGVAHGAAAFVTFASLSLFPLVLFSVADPIRMHRLAPCRPAGVLDPHHLQHGRVDAEARIDCQRTPPTLLVSSNSTFNDCEYLRVIAEPSAAVQCA